MVCTGIRILQMLSSAKLFILLILTLLAALPCYAAEGGIGAYVPGFRNYLAGVVPPKQGLYFRSDIIYYTATAPRVVLNGLPVENISVDAVLTTVEPMYVFPWKVFGAHHAFFVIQGFDWASLSGRIIGTDIEPSGRRSALGDTVVSPFYLGWHKGKTYFNTNLAIFIPTGDYDINRVVNLSRNYWTFDPEFGFTYFDPTTGWDLSGALGYSINTENTATQYTSGDILHLDYAIGKLFKNGFKPGVVGYAQTQVTPDSGPGALFGSFESRIFGIGPALQWRTSSHSNLMFRYYHEFGAKDHLEGDQFALTYRAAF